MGWWDGSFELILVFRFVSYIYCSTIKMDGLDPPVYSSTTRMFTYFIKH